MNALSAIPSQSEGALAAPAPESNLAAITDARIQGRDSQTPSPASGSNLEAITGLDVVTGLRLVMGKEKLYCLLLHKFATGEQDFSVRLENAIAQEDWVTAERLAHTLKSGAAQIGAHELRDQARQLEQAILQREAVAMLATRQAKVADHLAKLIAAIRSCLPSEPLSSGPEPFDEGKLREVCVRLVSLLAEDNYTSANLLKEHQNLLRTGLGTHFSPMAQAISDFNFPAALDELKAATAQYGFSR